MSPLDKSKYNLIVLIPLVVGWIMNRSIFMIQVYSKLIWIFAIGMVILWFWSGKIYARLYSNKIKGFLYGNSLWGISFVIFVWQFVFLNDNNRNITISALSQYYILCIVPSASKILNIITNTIDGTIGSLVAYFFMFIIFSIGFSYQLIKEKSHNFKSCIKS